ncbi:MAG: histidinol dehydrogenase [Actinomycetales bacterium]|nr:histidinol dehydrogenase [Actinomycetales bacterium]
MMRILDLRGRLLSKSEYQSLLPRAAFDVAAAMNAIAPIIDKVRSGGEAAVMALCEEFDGVRPASLRVPNEVIEQSLATVNPSIIAALRESIRRVRIVHRDQVREESVTRVVDGGEVRERWIPVDRVGLYVPGGRAVYPSSVIMNVVPAQVAGVASIALASPPQKEHGGWPHPTILATCALLGISEVYAIGGAQAIAAFAYGIKDVEGKEILAKVDMVTGPGNIYVAAAKRALRGIVGIDSEAGPTEIAIVADESARANEVAADLISQAEHDTIAAALLITPSGELAESVNRELLRRVARTKHSERIRTALSGEQSAIALVDSVDHGINVANAYAAEHLELLVREPATAAQKIRNAGAVFLGRFSPVSLGDYSAGSNHVLPTGGCACHSSGLSVQSFLRGLHFITYDEKAFREIAPSVITLANAEDLPAHGEAMSARFEQP